MHRVDHDASPRCCPTAESTRPRRPCRHSSETSCDGRGSSASRPPSQRGSTQGGERRFSSQPLPKRHNPAHMAPLPCRPKLCCTHAPLLLSLRRGCRERMRCGCRTNQKKRRWRNGSSDSKRTASNSTSVTDYPFTGRSETLDHTFAETCTTKWTCYQRRPSSLSSTTRLDPLCCGLFGPCLTARPNSSFTRYEIRLDASIPFVLSLMALELPDHPRR